MSPTLKYKKLQMMKDLARRLKYKRRIVRHITSDNKIYSFHQYLADSVIQQGTSVVFGTQAFQMNYLDQYATFQALFDTYRITKIKQTFRPMFTATSLNGASSAALIVPLMYTVIDFDDATNLGSIAAAREYQTCQIHDDKKAYSRTFKPKIAMSVYKGAFTGFAQTTGWIDCANPDVIHYGLKYVVSAGTSGSLQAWNVSTEMWIEFKNVR